MKLFLSSFITVVALSNTYVAVKGFEDLFDTQFRMTTKRSGCLCTYTLTVSFLPNPSMPFPEDIERMCSLGQAGGPSCAEDGKPYLFGRYHPYVDDEIYEKENENPYRFSKQILEATGFHSFSVDWTPCGHPNTKGFDKKPHYDLHFWRVDDKYRFQSMSCNQLDLGNLCSVTKAKFPACAYVGQPKTISGLVTGQGPFYDEEDFQESSAGKAHFVNTTFLGGFVNMPKNFICPSNLALPYFGIHCYEDKYNEWTMPATLFGTHAGMITFFEPMIPFEFTSGDENQFYEEEIKYLLKTDETLPSSYKVYYNATSGRVTAVLKGSSPRNTCEKRTIISDMLSEIIHKNGEMSDNCGP